MTVRHVSERDVVIPGVDGSLSGVLFEPDGGALGAAPGAAPGATGDAGLPAVVVVPEIDGFTDVERQPFRRNHARRRWYPRWVFLQIFE